MKCICGHEKHEHPDIFGNSCLYEYNCDCKIYRTASEPNFTYTADDVAKIALIHLDHVTEFYKKGILEGYDDTPVKQVVKSLTSLRTAFLKDLAIVKIKTKG